jgi:hypothetical protein
MESLLDLTLPAWSITFGFRWERLWKCGSSGESGTSFRMQECACSFFATVAICPHSRGHLDREYRNYRERWHSEPGLLASVKMQSPAYRFRYRCNDYTKIAINIDFLFDERCSWVEHLITSLASTPLRSASRRATQISGYLPGELVVRKIDFRNRRGKHCAQSIALVRPMQSPGLFRLARNTKKVS